jgi:hypothetical protein
VTLSCAGNLRRADDNPDNKLFPAIFGKVFRLCQEMQEGLSHPFTADFGELHHQGDLQRIVNCRQGLEETGLQPAAAEADNAVDDFLLYADIGMLERRLDYRREGRITKLGDDGDGIADDESGWICVKIFDQHRGCVRGEFGDKPEQQQVVPHAVAEHQSIQDKDGGPVAEPDQEIVDAALPVSTSMR